MNTKTSMWFNVKAEHVALVEGKDKKFKENYIVEAASCGQAEEIAMEKLACYTAGADILSVQKCQFSEVSFIEEDAASTEWYEATVQLITFDERTNKEKKTSKKYLVEATSINNAVKAVDEIFRGSVIDYVSVQVKLAKVVDVFVKDSGTSKNNE